MKKFLSLILLITIFITASSPVFAGSIDMDLVYDDDAMVFIGRISDFTVTHEEKNYPNKVCSITVIPTRKIKGEVTTEKEISFEDVSFGKVVPQKDKEYFFGYLSDELYLWELDSYDNLFSWEIDNYDKKSIILKERHNSSIAEGIQDLLNEGIFETAEIKRLNLGMKISLTEFLATSIGLTEKVTFYINGESYDVDTDKFFEMSDSIILTDVKDSGLKNAGSEDVMKNMLYITVTHNRGGEVYDSIAKSAFASVSEYGEVDRCSLMMSRIPALDFQMEKSDVQKLYTLLPDEVQENLPADNKYTQKNYLFVIFCFVAVAVIVGIFVFNKKKEKVV